MNVDLGYEVTTAANGLLEGGGDVTVGFAQELRYRNGQWTRTPKPIRSLTARDPKFELSGDFSAKVYLQPEVEVLVFSLAGANLGIEPYLQLAGHAQINPTQVTWTLSAGVPGSLELKARIWRSSWGELPNWPFSIVDDTVLASGSWNGPVIVQDPASRTVDVGRSATFSVSASGTAPLRYQWQRNATDLADGGRISGSRTRGLTISSAQSSDDGSYRVIVRNGAGRATIRSTGMTRLNGATPDPRKTT